MSQTESLPEAERVSTETVAELPGTRYKLERLLGDGGAGEVYRGVHLELDKPVAVKILREELSRDPDYSERFRREAKAASSIHHPGVVAVTDFGAASDGRLFLVMELIEGQTLAEIIQAGPVEPGRALRIGASLCDVLSVVHEAGIVHRDVKPGNVFLVGEDGVKLVDFGIARAGLLGGADWRITRTGRVCGTPGYMAPEHARNKNLDGRADLYSAGAVIYELLTGEPPFGGDSPVDVMMAQMSKRPDPPSKLVKNGGITRAMDKAVLRLLSVRKEDRFDTAAGVAEVLRTLADQADTRRQTAERQVHEPDRRPRSRLVLALVATILLGGLVAGAVVGVMLSQGGDDGQDNVLAAATAPTLSSANPGEDQETGPADPAGETEAAEPAEPAARADSTAPSAPATEADAAAASTPDAEPSQPATEEEAPARRDPTKLLEAARTALYVKSFGEAERLYKQASAAGARRSSVEEGLGRVYLGQGRNADAAKRLGRAVAGSPGSSSLRILYGQALLKSGNRTEAITQWRRVLETRPNNRRATALLESVGVTP